MGYWFSGFFVLANDQVLDAVKERWPYCQVREITTPFVGFGVRSPSVDDPYIYDDFDFDIDLDEYPDKLQQDLISWSRQFPSTDFVWINANCWAGMCDYWGFVCRNGEVILNHKTPSGYALVHLLTYLGVEQNGTYFAPFVRGFFR